MEFNGNNFMNRGIEMKKMILHMPQRNKNIEVSGDASLLDIMNKEDIAMYAPCGGKGACGKCKVTAKGDLSEISHGERTILTEEEIKKDIRLACRTYVIGEAQVELLGNNYSNKFKESLFSHAVQNLHTEITKEKVKFLAPTLENGYTTMDTLKEQLGNIKVDLEVLKKVSHCLEYDKEVTVTLYNEELIDVEQNDGEEKMYGVAIDIGTTTITCYLVNLKKGNSIGVKSIQNPQFNFGADVISRINYTIEKEDGLEKLTEVVRRAINNLIQDLCGEYSIDKKYIYKSVFVANTTMTHIFLGLNPKSLSKMPFNAITKDLIVESAYKLGIHSINKFGKIVLLPGVAGFVGADTVGAMIAADLLNDKNTNLLIDLGTNGEIVLSANEERYVCSTAAGPAFEGAKIAYGMQAFPGAINRVTIEEDIKFTTIDNQLPKGICGSGLIDIVSEFLKVGIIKEDGRILNPEEIENKKLRDRIIVKGRKKEFIIAYENETHNNKPILLTQKDIRELQLAKGAIRAGINILLKVAKIDFKNIDKILLAGTFGNFVDKENTRRLGLFPYIDLNKIISLGNAAGEGALMTLYDKDILESEAIMYSSTSKHIEISTHPDFQDEFIDSMYFK